MSGVHLVGLDTAVPGSWKGKVNGEQLKWLEQDLKENAGKRTVVFAHYNLTEFHPWDNEGDWRQYVLENAADVRVLLERFPSVQVVVSGHHHLCAARTIEGIHYITCPSLSSWPCRYSVFRIDRDIVNFSTHPVSSPSFIGMAWNTLLAFRLIRQRFPEGKDGEEEISRVFMGPQELILQLKR